ncbi:transposase [Marispirochaeta sp.]|jgi:transposase-like protein|uniref:transposase n=1 Tax=Marispirochaeta sp. TaxID=2038653 RepID=UPI0029C97A2A|nr:transposase [Marispirochaeta sp.]
MGERRKYTKEFTIEAVRLLNNCDKGGYEIEKDLGIGTGVIYRWRRELEEEGTEGIKSGSPNVIFYFYPALYKPSLNYFYSFFYVYI